MLLKHFLSTFFSCVCLFLLLFTHTVVPNKDRVDFYVPSYVLLNSSCCSGIKMEFVLCYHPYVYCTHTHCVTCMFPQITKDNQGLILIIVCVCSFFSTIKHKISNVVTLLLTPCILRHHLCVFMIFDRI